MLSYEELAKLVIEQKKEIEELRAEVRKLKEQLNKNSQNSSKPPSSDGYKKPSPKNQRTKSNKPRGGQKGHTGHNIALDKPDRIERVYPEKCANCPNKAHCDKLRVHDSRYVVDVVIKKETVKYQLLETCSYFF